MNQANGAKPLHGRRLRSGKQHTSVDRKPQSSEHVKLTAHTMSAKYSSLRKSRTQIIVPRNVDPENFVTVKETQKLKRSALWKAVIPILIFFVTVGIVAGSAFILYFSQDQDTLKWPKKTKFLETEGENIIYRKSSLKLPEKLEIISKQENSNSMCATSPCLNGGSCESHDGTFSCYCPQGFGGKLCDIEQRAVAFSEESYVTITTSNKVARSESRKSIKLQLRTSKSEGVILQRGNFSLSIVKSFIQLRIGQLDLECPEQLILDEWHTIELHTYHGDIMLRVDKGQPLVRSLHTSREREHMISDNLTIGGFTGCIQGLEVDNQLVNLLAVSDPLIKDMNNVTECPGLKGVG